MKLLEQFDRIVVFDTETTGLNFRNDHIIELGAVIMGPGPGGVCGGIDVFIGLPEGWRLPAKITELTGITDAMLREQGVPEEKAADFLRKLLLGARRPLLAAYNAQFDLCFLRPFLERCGMEALLDGVRFLDVMTVYKDRRDYPHKLCSAIAAYGLEDEAVNSHRAIDDAAAAARLLERMAEEKDDLTRYVDLFGTHPKYGRSGGRVPGITYRTQPYDRRRPLYDLT